MDTLHFRLESLGIIQPGRGEEIRHPLKKAELHAKTAQAGGYIEHGRLQLMGLFPGGFATGRGIQGKDQLASRGRRCHGRRPGDLIQE